MAEDRGISLNKYMASSGMCSRREADVLIKEGKVKINGKIATLGNRVMKGDKVTIAGKRVTPTQETVYIALNKPRGIVCTTDKREPKNIIDFVKYPERLFPIGRLDKQSQGLILMTNDGDIVNKILRAEHNHQKEYIVTVDKPLTQQFISKMQNGVPVLGQITKKCHVKPLGEAKFRIVLTQGLNRQIRRMCEHLGYRVKTLKRVRIMHIQLDDLKNGTWRYLTDKELEQLRRFTR